MLGQTGATQQVKETGWSRATSNLSVEIEQLKETIGILAQRIEPLFCPEIPADVSNKPTPTNPTAKAILEIDNFTYRIIELRKIVQEMLDRLEI